MWGKNNMGINSFQKSHIQTLNGKRLSGPQSRNERQRDRGKRRTMILHSSFYHRQDSAKVGSLPMSLWLTRKPSIKDRRFDNWQIHIISLICLVLCIFPFLVYLKEREKIFKYTRYKSIVLCRLSRNFTRKASYRGWVAEKAWRFKPLRKVNTSQRHNKVQIHEPMKDSMCYK